MKTINKIVHVLISILIVSQYCYAGEISSGMSRKELFERYTKSKERTYRVDGKEEWISFNGIFTEDPYDIITVHLVDETVLDWNVDDRVEIVKEYMSEFCSKYFLHNASKIGIAIRTALERVPKDVFFAVTDRAKPVVFTETHYRGTGRLANSSDIWPLEGDPPTFTDGIWITKLSLELETAEDPGEIESIIAHELAHYILDNGKRIGSDPGRVDQYERESADLVQKWGFGEEMIKAYERFGEKEENK